MLVVDQLCSLLFYFSHLSQVERTGTDQISVKLMDPDMEDLKEKATRSQPNIVAADFECHSRVESRISANASEAP